MGTSHGKKKSLGSSVAIFVGDQVVEPLLPRAVAHHANVLFPMMREPARRRMSKSTKALTPVGKRRKRSVGICSASLLVRSAA